jgi:hypothetical protein
MAQSTEQSALGKEWIALRLSVKAFCYLPQAPSTLQFLSTFLVSLTLKPGCQSPSGYLPVFQALFSFQGILVQNF